MEESFFPGWMPQENPYRLVALDIGNTLIQQYRPGLYRTLGLPEDGGGVDLGVEPFCPAFQQFLEGRISQEEYLEDFCRRFPGRWTKEQIRLAHEEYLRPALPGMPELIHKMADTGSHFVFFTDINTIHFPRFRQLTKGIFDFIQDAVRSDEVHALKPSPVMFRAFEERYGKPDLYLDDRADLIQGARQWGWNAVQAGDARRLKTVLFPEDK